MEKGGPAGERVFKSPGAPTRLYTATLNNQGHYLLPVVNNMAFTPILIDGPKNNGKLTIWGGLNGYDLKMISRKVEPVNPEIEEKRYKDDNPRPVPKVPSNFKQQRDASGRPIPQIF